MGEGKRKPQQQCIFCGRTPVTKEHVFSQWMSKVIAPTHSKHWAPSGSITSFEEKDAAIISFKPEKPNNGDVSTYQVKKVCGPNCNSGWMRTDFEDPARPILTPLFLGQEATLSSADQALISGWIAMKTIVIDSANMAMKTMLNESADLLPPVSQDLRTWFYEHKRPPDNWRIYLGFCDASIRGHEIFPVPFRFHHEGSVKKTYINHLTFVFGRLLIYVYAPGFDLPVQFTLSPRLQKLFVPIWPVQSSAINWPASPSMSRSEARDISHYAVTWIRTVEQPPIVASGA